MCPGITLTILHCILCPALTPVLNVVSFTVMRNRKQRAGHDHEHELPTETNTFVNNVTPKSDALDSWGLTRPLVFLLLEDSSPDSWGLTRPLMALLLEESFPAAGFSRVLGTLPEPVKVGVSQGLYS